MAVNSMNFEQSATMVSAIYEQMTGTSALAIVDESDFVRVGTTILKSGYDQLSTAISQVLERSIHGTRVYDSPYPSLIRDEDRWGGIVRKTTNLDLDYSDSKAWDAAAMANGQSVDPFEINRQLTIQTNFYGGQVEDLIVTRTRAQLETAFSSSAEFGSFWAQLAQDLANQITQRVEAVSRETINNLIAADITHNDDRVFHVLTEYKAETGNTTITAANYLSEAEFSHFAKWLFGALKTKKNILRNRSGKFHTNFTTYNGAAVSKEIMRFTPDRFLNVYMLSNFMNQVESSVLAATFHNELVGTGNYESVDFWQSIDAPDSISVTPNVLAADGTCAAAATPVESTGIIGFLFDDEACGITVKHESVESIYNPRGKYMNEFHTTAVRSYNDQTENSIVLMLD